MKDYFQVLGVTESSSPDEIRQAYRKLAKQNHPDVNHGDSEAENRFKEIQEAYDVLSDDSKRNRYIASRNNPFASASGRGFGGGGFGAEDFLNIIFNASARQQSPDNYIDVLVKMNLEQVAKKEKVKVDIPWNDRCGICKGFGSKTGKTAGKCVSCNGMGYVNQTRHGTYQTVKVITTCPDCQGEGRSISVEDRCGDCGGNGFTDHHKNSKTIEIMPPDNARHGLRTVLHKQGPYLSYNGERSKIRLTFSFETHPIFQVTNAYSGFDLIIALPITYYEAAIGSTLNVPTLYGSHKLKLKKGTQNGELIEIKGHGLPYTDQGINRRGSLFAQVVIETPNIDPSKFPDGLPKEVFESEGYLPKTYEVRNMYDKYSKGEKI